MIKKPELLAPAGSLTKLKIAVTYGADAVYVGGEEFSLRVAAENFSPEELAEGVKFAHERGKKVYLTANIIPHNADIAKCANRIIHMRNGKIKSVKTNENPLSVNDIDW